MLRPGELAFGDATDRIRTLLGSCVAFTLWHPGLRIGGMCHFLLPTRGGPAGPDFALDGRYADEALELLLHEIARRGTDPHDYEAKVFGGGSQFTGASSGTAGGIDVPRRNVLAGLELLDRIGLPVVARHLGGSGPRQVILDVGTGEVWLRHTDTTLEGAQA